MKWLIEADRDCGSQFSWISIPGVASIVYWVKSAFGTTLVRPIFLDVGKFVTSKKSIVDLGYPLRIFVRGNCRDSQKFICCINAM
jgi:hypothetical protein